jgi:hypothetical protein
MALSNVARPMAGLRMDEAIAAALEAHRARPEEPRGGRPVAWDETRILRSLEAFRDAAGRPPTHTDLNPPPPGLPSAATVRRRFGCSVADVVRKHLQRPESTFGGAGEDD